jgi:glutathione peroxidase
MNKIFCFFAAVTFLTVISEVAGGDTGHGRSPRLVSSPTGTGYTKPHRFSKPVRFDATGFYDFTITDIDGNNISLRQFQGKKILFVNTATNSSYTNQYASLEQLYQKYKDSLVIIAIPSNSFGNEAGDNAAIKHFIISNYHVHFIIAQKMEVAGSNQTSLYSWLTHIEQNNMMSNTIDGDFYKFLVDGQGRLVGAFVSSVDPMGEDVQSTMVN